MEKQYIYELKINDYNLYKIIDFGVVLKENEKQITQHKCVYINKTTIGYYMIKTINKKFTIITLKLNQDLGASFECYLNLRPKMAIYYDGYNKYSNEILVESILIGGSNNTTPYKAKRVCD